MFHFTRHADLAYHASRWSRYLWDRRVNASQKIQGAVQGLRSVVHTEIARDAETPEERAALYDTAGEESHGFGGEIFSRLYNDPKRVDGANGWAPVAHGIMDESPEFNALRSMVEGDADMAAIATEKVLQTVSERLPALLEALEDHEDEQDEQDEQDSDDEQGGGDQDGQGQDDEDGDDSQEGGDNGQGGGTPGADDLGRAGQALRAALRRAATEAQETVNEAREALAAVAPGMEEAPEISGQEDTHRLTLAEMILNDPRFQEVLRRAGKLQRLAERRDMTTNPHGVGTVVGVERGADLGRALPSSLVHLGSADPALQALAFAQVAERKVLQYRMEGQEPQGKGPVVVLVDESGSMDGDREQWARAVVLATVLQAQRDGRKVSICYFDHRIKAAHELDESGNVWNLSTATGSRTGRPWGKAADLVQSLLTRYSDGGTDFDAPMSWAMDYLENEDERADVVFVTDGDAVASQGTLDRVQAACDAGARVFGLTVGYGHVPASVQDLCTECVAIDTVPEDKLQERLTGAVPVRRG